jgi:hypothetical protein
MSMPNAFLVSYPMQLAKVATNSYRSRVFHFCGIMMAKSFPAGKSERQIISNLWGHHYPNGFQNI